MQLKVDQNKEVYFFLVLIIRHATDQSKKEDNFQTHIAKREAKTAEMMFFHTTLDDKFKCSQ